MKSNLFRLTKISWKLTILYASLFSLVLILLNASVLYGIKYYLINQGIQKANDTSNLVVEKMNGHSAEKMAIDDPDLLDESKYDSTIGIRIANADKVAVNMSDHFKWPDIPFPDSRDSVHKVENNEMHFLIENSRLISGEKVTAYIQVIINMEKEYAFLDELFILLAIADFIGILVSLLAGYLVGRRILQPIDRITKTAQNISIDRLDQRIAVSQTDDELSRLAGTFNEMIDRLQISFEKQNQFVSDASHELRTPISVIQGYIGLIDRWGKDDRNVLQESIDAIKNETAGMTELIEKLLILARGESGNLKLQKCEFGVNELISEISWENSLVSDQHRIQIETSGEISMFADRKLVKQMLRAIIDNSIKYTPPDGTIIISAVQMESGVEISIKDTGVGIPRDEIGRIFNRFYRVDKARSKETGGSGLGLSIVKLIVDAHSGTITVDSDVGEGTCVSILLPWNSNQ